MDIDALLKGKKYTELKENYVIFICMFDPFGEDLPEYFFENICRQKRKIKLNDKSYKACYNVNAFAKADNGKVKAFLEYLKTQNARDDFTQLYKLRTWMCALAKREFPKEILDSCKRHRGRLQRGEFMMRNIFVDDWFDIGVAVGEERGVSRGAHNARMETARNFLALGVATPEQIAQSTGLPLVEVMQLSHETVYN